MRFALMIALLHGYIALNSTDAVAQEGGKGGTSAAAAEKNESDEEALARRQRALLGNVTKIELNGKTIAVSYGDTPTDGPDYRTLATIKDGELVQLTKSIVTKLKTGSDLQFGDVTIEAGNVAKDYPGVYGLWLKRVDDGWHMVFSEYADVWGTQHFPEGDVAEIPLDYAKTDAEVEQYTVTLEETDGRGSLTISWGEYRWAAPFTVSK